MEQNAVAGDKMKIIVWGVRIVAILFILFLLLTVISDLLNPLPGTTLTVKHYFLYFLWILWAVGLILGFKDEYIGGAIGTGTALLHIIILLFGGGFTKFWLLFLTPGLLYFLIWKLKKRTA